jgi:hypothetical protein
MNVIRPNGLVERFWLGPSRSTSTVMAARSSDRPPPKRCVSAPSRTAGRSAVAAPIPFAAAWST